MSTVAFWIAAASILIAPVKAGACRSIAARTMNPHARIADAVGETMISCSSHAGISGSAKGITPIRYRQRMIWASTGA